MHDIIIKVTNNEAMNAYTMRMNTFIKTNYKGTVRMKLLL